MPLIPLLEVGLIETKNIIINAKFGVIGSGRREKEENLYTKIVEGINSYGVTRHRHVPEIEQGLCDASKSKLILFSSTRRRRYR